MTAVTDWDDAYANRAHVAEAGAIVERWPGDAAAFRASWADATLDLPYGPAERERFDLFRPAGPAAGLLVFVHGGYWMAFDKSVWSHFAEGALKRGWAVAIPSYSLAPEARIAQMTRQIAAAITAAAQRVDGPVRLTGHSAGGHLVARMACADSPLNLGDRLAGVVSISGLHDLEPLARTAMNATLRLDKEEVAAESPALLAPRPGLPVGAWVGGGERPEFIRQAGLLASAWPGTVLTIEGDYHHFNIIDALRAPHSPLMNAVLG
ncbi:MAG: alpha/beta hydrolase [Roseivivax sp.]|nr:alpha/beta hydrolase [Roseivivax sp.]